MNELANQLELSSDLSGNVPLLDLAAVMGLSFALTMAIGWLYRATHRGVSYSQTYVHTLVLLGTVVSLIMLIVGSSVARAFTLVGALSIIRFRNAMKETRDVGFVFMSMAIGMAVGTRFYVIAIVSTVILSLMVLVLYRMNVFNKHVQERILRVQIPTSVSETAIDEPLRKYLEQYHLLALETVRAGTLNEAVYSIVFRRNASPQSLLNALRVRNENHKVALILGQQEVDI